MRTTTIIRDTARAHRSGKDIGSIRAKLGKETKRRLRDAGYPVASEKPRIKGDYLYGLHPVRLSLAFNSRTFNRLYVQDSLVETSDSVKEILRLAENAGIEEVHTKTKAQLNLVSENRPHQGVILDAEELDLPFLHQYPMPYDLQDEPFESKPLQTQNPILIAPDMITDPQNIGTLMRNAVFYGCARVIVSKSLTTPLNGIVSKSSAGALEVLAAQGRLVQVNSLPKFLEGSRSNGWAVMGTHVSDENDNRPLPDTIHCTHPELAKAFAMSETAPSSPNRPPLILVMGSEGEGLRYNTLRCCSHTIRIPGAPMAARDGVLGGVDSLNVSVASGVLLHTLKSFSNSAE